MIVYFIEALSSKTETKRPIKIGTTVRIEERIKQLQTSNYNKLSILFYIVCKTTPEAVSMEKLIHSAFSEYSMSGEWFSGAIRNTSFYGDLLNREDVVMGEKFREDKINTAKENKEKKKKDLKKKGVTSFNMDNHIHEEIKRRAKADNRSKSDWLNLHLIDWFNDDEKHIEKVVIEQYIIDKALMPKIPELKIKPLKFIAPKQSDIKLFEVNENLNLSGFFDYYESNGWKVGKNTMKDWKAAARGWSKRQSTYNRGNSNKQDFSDDSTDWVNRDYGLL